MKIWRVSIKYFKSRSEILIRATNQPELLRTDVRIKITIIRSPGSRSYIQMGQRTQYSLHLFGLRWSTRAVVCWTDAYEWFPK